MTEHNPQNIEDDTFDRPGHGGQSTQKLVCDWLRANGIDPSRVARDARASMVDGNVTLVMKVSDPDRPGCDVIAPSGDEVLKENKTFPVTVPPPPLVAEWLAPTCPTCGR